MMKHVSKIVLTALCMVATVTLVAQSQKKDEATGAAKADDKTKKVKPKPVPVFLGNTDLSSGMITKKLFDSLLQQGLTSKDSTGREFKVHSFLFSYGERNLYEDSVGNPMILTDYLSESCDGNMVSDFLKKNIPERSKPNDTVIFDHITVLSPEGAGGIGRSMKFVLKK